MPKKPQPENLELKVALRNFNEGFRLGMDIVFEHLRTPDLACVAGCSISKDIEPYKAKIVSKALQPLLLELIQVESTLDAELRSSQIRALILQIRQQLVETNEQTPKTVQPVQP